MMMILLERWLGRIPNIPTGLDWIEENDGVVL